MFSNANRIVVKVGTSTLTHETGRLNLRHISGLVRVLSDIMNKGHQVVLVTSGAIGVGVGKLKLKERPSDTPGRQAAASVGQCELMFAYDKMFAEYGHTVGQMLLTKSDVDDAERRRNLINAFETLLKFGAIPVVNENDCVAVEEIVYGDNDCLSAIVAKLIHADLLMILTDIDGLYDANPAEHPNASRIPVVERITGEILGLAGGSGTKRGTGGMATKINAAQIAGEAGIPTVIINGTPTSNIYHVLEGKSIGTVFLPVAERS